MMERKTPINFKIKKWIINKIHKIHRIWMDRELKEMVATEALNQ